MRRTSLLPTLIGVLLVIGGIYSLFSPVATSTVIPYVIGLALIVTGIGKMLRRADERRFYGESRWSLAGAIVSLFFGIVLVMSPALQLSMGASMIMLIGCWITVMGVLRIIHAFRLRKVTGYTDMFGRPVSNDWFMALLPGAAMVIIGMVNVLHPAIGLGMIGALIGILMILCGSSLLSLGSISWYW